MTIYVGADFKISGRLAYESRFLLAFDIPESLEDVLSDTSPGVHVVL